MKINVKRDKNNYIVLDRVIAKNKILHVYTVEIDYLICITNIRCMIICIKFLIQLHDLLYDLLYIFFILVRISKNTTKRDTQWEVSLWWRTIDKQCYEEGNCMSKDIIIKEILPNGSAIDSVAVLHTNKWISTSRI